MDRDATADVNAPHSMGKTIIGVTYNGGVFLGADSRTSTGLYVANRASDKITQLADNVYMAPFSLNSDNVIAYIMNQSVPPTTWYRLVAGLNAQLRLVRRGRLRIMFPSIVTWIETFANPNLKDYGLRVDLALFQATSKNNHQYGLVVSCLRDDEATTRELASINALFIQGPRRSAELARVYALWNVTSLVNVVVAFICGYAHYSTQPSKTPSDIQPWTMEESEWWIFPVALVLCKCIQSVFINWHTTNMEIHDRSLYSSDAAACGHECFPDQLVIQQPRLLLLFMVGAFKALYKLFMCKTRFCYQRKLRPRRVLSRMLKLPSHPRRLLLSVV